MFTGLRSQDQLQLDGGYLGGQMEWKLNHGSLLSCMGMDLFLGPIWTINDYNIYNIGEGICIVSHCWLISAFNWWIWCELAMYFQRLASLNLHVLRCFSLEVTFQIEAMLHLKVCKLRFSHIPDLRTLHIFDSIFGSHFFSAQSPAISPWRHAPRMDPEPESVAPETVTAFQRWARCFCVCVFDLEQGQRLLSTAEGKIFCCLHGFNQYHGLLCLNMNVF